MRLLFGLIAGSAVLAASAGAGTARPHISLATTAPVSIRGAAFVPSERVTVVVHTGGLSGRTTVTTTQAGTFLARFRGVRTAGSCSAVFANAKGNRGSTAWLRLAPECAPGPVDQ